MKIQEVHLNKFKRFTDLTIKDIPESVKLVVLVGPNGCGKTSIFEAFNHWYKYKGYRSWNSSDVDYFVKSGDVQDVKSSTWYDGRVTINAYDEALNSADNIKDAFIFVRHIETNLILRLRPYQSRMILKIILNLTR